MKRFPALLILLTSGDLVVSCANSTPAQPHVYQQLEHARWFIGRWENTSDQGVLSETWKQENDSVFAGASYFVIGRDTVFEEHIRLEETHGKLVYSPTIADQNAGKPVPFTMTHASEKELVFENPKHDFPQKITYTLRNDSLIAVISGMQQGKAHEEVFAMGNGK